MLKDNALLKMEGIEEREYQINISRVASELSTLVVLPTGMGKTLIAFMVMAERLKKFPEKKILFLAPTKPLVNQHARDIEATLDVEVPRVFTGEVSPEDREELWKSNNIIVSTPQVIKNDLMARRIDLDEVSLTVFDEAHRAVGDYSYVYIGEMYREMEGRSLGLTASPGSEIEDILEVCNTLGFEHVEIRTKFDPDVVNYTNRLEKEWIEVKLNESHKRIVENLKDVRNRYVEKLRNFGFLEKKKPDRVTRKDLIEVRKEVQGNIHSSNDSSLYHAASLVASAIKVDHAVDQAETQGIESLREYLEKIKNEAETRGGSKAAKRIMDEQVINDVLATLKNFDEEHPKVDKVARVVKDQIEEKKDSRIIVFTNYRNTSMKITERLAKVEGVRPVRFIGQTDKEGDSGLKQNEQIETLEEFEKGRFNVLVATSVGEEGLDIPATDLVVFYEPVPSEIRTIQRRGRTARKRKGKVVILITKDTRDEAYYWSSKNKEKRMHRNLMKLRDQLESEISVGDPMKEDQDLDVVEKKSKKDLKKENKEEKLSKDESQRSLMDYDKDGEKKKDEEKTLEITVDTREQNSKVVESLSKKDVKIETSQLSVGDYIISGNTAVERKEVSDFLESVTDGRLFAQARELTDNYRNPVIILEGEGLYKRRNISDNAIYGALSSLACDFNIPVLSTKDGEETSSLLYSMVQREKGEKKKSGVRKGKKSMSDHDRRLYILEGLPSISGVLAERLLEHFGSVRKVFQADTEELQEVEGIGPSTVEKILDIIEK
ncbi:MAG: DEAD/DEAH box helicase [Thermoplasmata archaeon]